MEEFYQYIGPHDGVVSSCALLTHERMFVYSSPRNNPIERCGELRLGSYFACSAVLYYDDNVWLKIRRGYFSNAKNNGYIRVYLNFLTGSTLMEGSEVPSRQRSSVVAAQPAQFRHMRRLPKFPTYMCARDRLVLYREPVFNLHSASVSSSDSSSTTPRHVQRYLPPVSVFKATEYRLNQDFTQLAVKVTSAFAGLGGWINASFHKTLIEVECPKQAGFFRHGPVYMQNVAGRGGKWAGELPVRAIPSLQAPRLYNVESFRVVRAIERKLLKDRVWIRIQSLRMPKELQHGSEHKSEKENSGVDCDDQEEEQTDGTTGPDAWIIERNANTAERVVVPWGTDRIQDVPANDDAERFYRTVYSRRSLPLRRTADLEAEIVGYLEPGFVFSSTLRILNDRGRMWIRVALPSEKSAHISKNVGDDGGKDNDTNSNPDNNAEESKEEEEVFDDGGKCVRYGYAIQSNAKTNTCMVQEIPSPGTINPKQYYQVLLLPDDTQVQTTSSNLAEGVTENKLSARVEASSSAKELFYVKNGAILSAIGSVYNAEQGRMWLQVLATDLDPAMRVKSQRPLSDVEQNLNVVYLPICGSNRNSSESVLKPIHRELVRIDNPTIAGKDGPRPSSRVVFSGRASKLFGSHLLRPSTIGLPSALQKKHNGSESQSTEITVPDLVVRAADENERAQSLKDEITAWQLETGNRMTQLYTQVGSMAGYTLSCVRRPFASCLAHQEAKRRYQQLDQDSEGMEEYALDDDEVHV